jgi:hypothetical protein
MNTMSDSRLALLDLLETASTQLHQTYRRIAMSIIGATVAKKFRAESRASGPARRRKSPH